MLLELIGLTTKIFSLEHMVAVSIQKQQQEQLCLINANQADHTVQD
jgi:hypothetical protein